MRELSYLEQQCISNCIKYKAAKQYKSVHKVTDDETIAHYAKGINKEHNLVEICEVAGVSLTEVKEFISDVEGIVADLVDKGTTVEYIMSPADWVIAFVTNKRNQDIESICELANISVPRFKGIKRKHPDWTHEEILGYCILNPGKETANKIYKLEVNGKTYNLSELSKLLDVNYRSVLDNISSEKDILDELSKHTSKVYRNMFGKYVVNLPKENNTKLIENKQEPEEETTLYVKCKDLGLSYDAIRLFQMRNPHVSEDLILKKYKTPDKLTFKDKCEIANVKYKTATNYRAEHKELTDEQVINKVKANAKRRNK